MEQDAVADRPRPFGYKMAWLAIRSQDSKAVAEAAGFVGSRPASWQEGIDSAYGGGTFVTPPIGEWVLVVGGSLADSVQAPAGAWRKRLQALSSRFGVAQLFFTHRVAEMHVWARAREGIIERAYGYLGESGETLLDEGEQTPEENALGLRFFDERCPEAEDDAYWEREDLSYPDEDTVMAIAERWSIAPVSLSESSAEPSLGLLRTRGAPARPQKQDKRPWWRFW
jgi:hypothetical protein